MRLQSDGLLQAGNAGAGHNPGKGKSKARRTNHSTTGLKQTAEAVKYSITLAASKNQDRRGQSETNHEVRSEACEGGV